MSSYEPADLPAAAAEPVTAVSPSPAEAEASPRLRPPDELPRALRPEAKLGARGPGALASAELLSLLLKGAARRETPIALAQRLLRRERLCHLAALGARDWRERAGIGEGAAARLCAAFELGRRAGRVEDRDLRPRLSRPRQVYWQVRHLGRARKEHLVGLYVDAQNVLLHRETLSIGSLNTTRTHPREILYPAVTHLAYGFVLAHNHPSGCVDPSREDVEFTSAVQRAAALLGIELLDHLIVARDGYTSLRERGLI